MCHYDRLFAVISRAPPHVPQVDFQDVEARTLAERRRQEEKQQRLERIYKEKLEKAKQEMEGKPGFAVLLLYLFSKQK